MKRYIFIILAIVLIVITYFTHFFIKRKKELTENMVLRQENQDLKAQIERRSMPSIGGEAVNQSQKAKYIKALVFSTYPFNIKNQIVVGAGENQGVKNGMVVLLGENILVGQIKEASVDMSAVETIFSPNFEIPVRIGEAGVDSFFQGGNEPKIVLIDKTKPVKTGDFVYSAGSPLPYGLKVGDISEIKENTAGVFKEAILKIPFNAGDLREINILVKP